MWVNENCVSEHRTQKECSAADPMLSRAAALAALALARDHDARDGRRHDERLDKLVRLAGAVGVAAPRSV